MRTTREDISRWLERAKEKNATHMIVLCDTFDYDDYPVFCSSREEAEKRRDHPGTMQKFMECYRLDMDWGAQLAQHRARNF